jgi:hypothetical protein
VFEQEEKVGRQVREVDWQERKVGWHERKDAAFPGKRESLA